MPTMRRWNGTSWDYLAAPASIDPVVLARRPTPGIPATGTTVTYANLLTGRLSAREDLGGNALIDYRRAHGLELRQWRAALAGRDLAPANVVFVGDSLSEGAGATSFNGTFVDLFRDSIQREYRAGGEGFIPALQITGMSFPPRWTMAGTPTVTDFGAGLARHAVFFDTTDDSMTITAYCDRFWIMYLSNSSSGTFKVVVDGVTLGTVNANSTLNKCGNIYDSGQLPVLGNHTIQVTPNAAGQIMIIEGGVFFATDGLNGVHVWNGGHGGYSADRFNGDASEDALAVGARRGWAQTFFQPHTVATSTVGGVTGNGTTTITWSGGTFDNYFIGEPIWAGNDQNAFPNGVRIVSITDATHAVVNKIIPAGSYTCSVSVARVTNGTCSTATQVVSSPSWSLNQWDVGKTIVGPNLYPGTTIKSVDSPTQATLNVWAQSAATGTAIFQIINRQKYPARPHLLIPQFGGNEEFNYSQPKAVFKANLQALYQTCVDTGQLDIPTMTGVYNDERPSVALMTAWAPGFRQNANLILSTQAGSNVLGQSTTGQLAANRFTATDIGRQITCASLTGGVGTITGIGAFVPGTQYSETATASVVASATSTNVTATLDRTWTEAQWHDFRAAANELADTNGWAHFDLYNVGGYSGGDTMKLIAADNVHPNPRGQLWIADELSALVGGVKRLASIPTGIFNNPGEIIKATAADVARVVPGIKVKTSADVAASATIGTYTDITELAFPIGAGDTLTFQFYIIYTSPIATSGITFRLGGSANMSVPADFVMAGVAPATGATLTYVGTTTASAWPNGTITATGSNATTTPVVLQVYGTITAGTVGGIVTPQFTTEVASSAPTVQRGSFAVIL